ncbi:MAG: hypothetical protein K0U59_06505 [Gammaproteobacteria bacterium]|nr:hypothetical protein [Gammaproteobacteria bacterium]
MLTRLPRHPIEISTSSVADNPQSKEAAMPNHAPVAPVCRAGPLITQCLDLAGISLETAEKLRTLFHAIARMPDNTSTSQELAALGAELADQWANVIDCERENLELMRGAQPYRGDLINCKGDV